MELVGQLKDILGELKDYIKANHTTGLAWNPRGESLAAAQEAACTLSCGVVGWGGRGIAVRMQ